MSNPRERLASAIQSISSEFWKKIAFLTWLNAELTVRHASKAILVGGSAMEFYSWTRFQSEDIDLVCASRKELAEIFSDAGFGKDGRYWYEDAFDIIVEVPDDELAGEMKRIFTIRTGSGNSTAYVIGIEDLIIDRLEQYVFAKANESLEQAYWLVDSKFEWKSLDREYLLSKIREKGMERWLSSAKLPVYQKIQWLPQDTGGYRT